MFTWNNTIIKNRAVLHVQLYATELSSGYLVSSVFNDKITPNFSSSCSNQEGPPVETIKFILNCTHSDPSTMSPYSHESFI